MNSLQALILSLIEGLTEFLPISSTAHLVFAGHYLGADLESPAAMAYLVIVQFAAILAVPFIFKARMVQIWQGLTQFEHSGLLLIRNLCIAFIPTGLIGLTCGQYIEAYLRGPWVMGSALILGAPWMLWVHRQYYRAPSIEQDLHALTLWQCLFIGSMQTLALCPGLSRSMMTLTACMLIGLQPLRCLEFAFGLGFLTIFVASAYQILQRFEALQQAFSPSILIASCLVSFATALYVGRWFVHWMPLHGLIAFAYYRILFGAGLLWSVYHSMT